MNLVAVIFYELNISKHMNDAMAVKQSEKFVGRFLVVLDTLKGFDRVNGGGGDPI